MNTIVDGLTSSNECGYDSTTLTCWSLFLLLILRKKDALTMSVGFLGGALLIRSIDLIVTVSTTYFYLIKTSERLSEKNT